MRAVYYPGLPSHPQHELARALFAGFGALLSFELDPALDCFDFLNRLQDVVKRRIRLECVYPHVRQHREQ